MTIFFLNFWMNETIYFLLGPDYDISVDGFGVFKNSVLIARSKRVADKLLRHSGPLTTLGTYLHHDRRLFFSFPFWSSRRGGFKETF